MFGRGAQGHYWMADQQGGSEGVRERGSEGEREGPGKLGFEPVLLACFVPLCLAACPA